MWMYMCMQLGPLVPHRIAINGVINLNRWNDQNENKHKIYYQFCQKN